MKSYATRVASARKSGAVTQVLLKECAVHEKYK